MGKGLVPQAAIRPVPVEVVTAIATMLAATTGVEVVTPTADNVARMVKVEAEGAHRGAVGPKVVDLVGQPDRRRAMAGHGLGPLKPRMHTATLLGQPAAAKRKMKTLRFAVIDVEHCSAASVHSQ